MNDTRVILGIADGGVPVWEIADGVPVMGNAVITRRWPPKGIELWVDSGGFQVMMRGLSLGVRDVAEAYRKIEADYYIMLDHPPPYAYGGREHAERNYRLFEELYTALEDRRIIPVVHQYDWDTVEWLLEKYDAYKPPILAVGGAVPGLMNKGKKKVATTLYITVIRRLWKRQLHVLGAGTPTARGLLSLIGVDTADSTTWRAKAAYGKVLIPGAGERYVGSRRIKFGPLYASPDDIEKLDEFLENTGFPIPYSDIRELLNTFKGRAFVNAWVLMKSPPVVGKGYGWIKSLVEATSRMDLDEIKRLHDRVLASKATL